ncbi:MAG TPA: hypothetical protein VG497_22255 [Kribbella sp.]|nr:hypothetical protein [Amycolatopsis sp.]HWD81641.1 hypothetical protein [Kribbella sp.]
MRPTPDELITHVRRVLRDVVEPELTSSYARSRLAEIRAALAQIPWNEAGLRLADASDTLRDLLLKCRTWIESDEARKKHFADSLPAFAGLPEAVPEDFAACNEIRARYDELVIELIGPLEDWLLTGKDDGTGAELRRELLSAVVS